MAWDHRFRSGAVIAVTGVIAGANALRALLLDPAGTPAVATAMPQVDAVPQQDQRTQEQNQRKAPRPVRPAIYPLREFFAWTR